MIETGCAKGPGRQCARKETTRSSSESYYRMEQLNISKRPPIICSPRDGERFEVVGTNVDVTERKRAEKALRESEAKIRRLVDANIIGIFIWDFEGRIIEANDAFLRMVGYDREDLASGRIRWTELTPPEWRDSR